jgi:hypothetical protein
MPDASDDARSEDHARTKGPDEHARIAVGAHDARHDGARMSRP